MEKMYVLIEFIKNHQKLIEKIIFLYFLAFLYVFLFKFVEKMKNLHFLDYPRSCLDLASILPIASILPRSCLDLTSILPRSYLDLASAVYASVLQNGIS